MKCQILFSGKKKIKKIFENVENFIISAMHSGVFAWLILIIGPFFFFFFTSFFVEKIRLDVSCELCA